MGSATVTSLDGFHATRSAQRADELVRTYLDAVNVEDPARIDELLARSFLSYDVHGTRSRTAVKRYHAIFGNPSPTFALTYTRTSACSSRAISSRYGRSSAEPTQASRQASTRPATRSRRPPHTSSAFATTISSSTGRSSTPTESWSRPALSPVWRACSSSGSAFPNRRTGCSKNGSGPSSARKPDAPSHVKSHGP